MGFPGYSALRFGGLVQQLAVVIISWEMFVTHRIQLETNPCYIPSPQHSCGENSPREASVTVEQRD